MSNNQEKEAAHLDKAAELLTKAYHEENIQNELRAIPEGERKDILDKMQQIDKGMHALPKSIGQHIPNLEIVDDGANTYVGVKGDKLRDQKAGDKINLVSPVNDQKIMKDNIIGSNGEPGSTKWVGNTPSAQK